jgi:hypothetical protein
MEHYVSVLNKQRNYYSSDIYYKIVGNRLKWRIMSPKLPFVRKLTKLNYFLLYYISKEGGIRFYFANKL